ncbi:hypothetical protein DDE05_10850 [Streptomyces cavourensis]|nr:hypothetical protein DDE05_10850 [Streptomyces cavourensis]
MTQRPQLLPVAHGEDRALEVAVGQYLGGVLLGRETFPPVGEVGAQHARYVNVQARTLLACLNSGSVRDF